MTSRFEFVNSVIKGMNIPIPISSRQDPIKDRKNIHIDNILNFLGKIMNAKYIFFIIDFLFNFWL
jgi:hypothetical protein